MTSAVVAAAGSCRTEHASPGTDVINRQDQTPDANPSVAKGSGDRRRRPFSADGVLTASTIFWFVVAATGQAFFAIYIALFYGGTSLRGDVQAWNEVVPGRVVAGDLTGFLAMAAHVALAFVVTAAGPLQLIPILRARLPGLHRWTGRVYVCLAFIISLGGLYLVWGHRDADDTLLGSSPLTLNAFLIMGFAAMTLKHALARRIDIHRRWALRLFLAMSGVWFLRVGVMMWILTLGVEGLGARLDGPVGTFLKFACYGVPLIVLEIYFMVRRQHRALPKLAMAGVITILTLLMGGGIGMAATVFWLPHI